MDNPFSNLPPLQEMNVPQDMPPMKDMTPGSWEERNPNPNPFQSIAYDVMSYTPPIATGMAIGNLSKGEVEDAMWNGLDALLGLAGGKTATFVKNKLGRKNTKEVAEDIKDSSIRTNRYKKEQETFESLKKAKMDKIGSKMSPMRVIPPKKTKGYANEYERRDQLTAKAKEELAKWKAEEKRLNIK